MGDFGLFMEAELAEAGSKPPNENAPRTDRVSDMVLKEVIRVRPESLLNSWMISD